MHSAARLGGGGAELLVEAAADRKLQAWRGESDGSAGSAAGTGGTKGRSGRSLSPGKFKGKLGRVVAAAVAGEPDPISLLLLR